MFDPEIEPTVSTPRYFSSIWLANTKKDSEGKQSSSRMIASSTLENTQSSPVATLVLHPRFVSEKLVRTSHSQSTARAI